MRTNRTENLELLTQYVKDIKNKDVNGYLLRFTDLYMDGSYSGYETYKLNIRKYNKCKSDETRLAFCYSMLVHMCKIEFGSWVDKNMMTALIEGNLSEKEMKWFNNELLERAHSTLSSESLGL